jgi:hypothetical protein
MTKSLFDWIKKSEWMHSDSCEFLRFTARTPQYLVFERITLNVAASHGIPYREMLKAKSDSNPMYAPFCISLILIDRTFRNIFNIPEHERISLIGYQDYKIIEDFKRYKQFG